MIFRPPSSELRNSDSAMANISARALTLERSTRSASPVSVVLPLYSHKRRRSQRPSEAGHIRLGKDPGRWQRQKSKLHGFPCAQCRTGVTEWSANAAPSFQGYGGFSYTVNRVVCPVMEATAIKVRVRMQATHKEDSFP